MTQYDDSPQAPQIVKRKRGNFSSSDPVEISGPDTGKSTISKETLMDTSKNTSMNTTTQKQDASNTTFFSSKLFVHLLFFIAFALRIVVIVISSYYDKSALVKYTDVDYYVFTDAARFVYEDPWHGSPYQRKTYRYTPLLAYMLLPNFIFSQMFGKIIFSLIDIFIAWLIIKIGIKCEREKRLEWSKKKDQTIPKIPLSSWILVTSITVLFNPIVFNISTRGNADQLVLLLVLLSLYFFYRSRYLTCAFFYGLSVHFKIYPIIYAPAFFLAVADRKFNPGGRFYPSKTMWDRMSRTLKLLGRGLVNVHLWLFTLLSAGVFLLLGALFYKIYGFECIYETYLYHLIRSDNRHNFSVYFYHIYLSVMEPNSTSALLMFVPQLFVLFLMALLMYRNILECILVQTMTFVAFNKVCTVQYFVWYIPLFSFLILRSRKPLTRKLLLSSVLLPVIIWFTGHALWLQGAYELEFLGKNTFLRIWVCGLIFFVTNIGSIVYVLLTK